MRPTIRLHFAAATLCIMAAAAPALSQTIDGSSPAAFEQSIEAMAGHMDPAERAVFSTGLMRLSLKRYPPAVGLDDNAAWMFGPAAIEAAPRTLDGIGLSEILAAGQQQADAEAERLAQAELERQQRAELDAMLEEALAAQDTP